MSNFTTFFKLKHPSSPILGSRVVMKGADLNLYYCCRFFHTLQLLGWKEEGKESRKTLTGIVGI